MAARSAPFVVGAVMVWWVANTVATIASKSVMRGGDHSSGRGHQSSGLTPAFRDLRWVELTLFQHVAGVVLAGTWLKVTGRSLWPAQARQHRPLLLIAALGNVVGNSATNAAYSLITSSTAQVVKACEPLFTFFLSIILYRNYSTLDVSTLLSVLVIVVGAASFLLGDASFNLWGVTAAMISNTAFPTRNIFLKKLSDVWDSPLQKFAVMSLFSAIFALPAWLGKVLVFGGLAGSLGRAPESGVSSLFHAVYNLASVTVLESVSPVTHAILNISKRLFVIMANVVYFHVPFSFHMFVSLLVLLAGCYLYQLKNGSTAKLVTIKSVLILGFLVYLFLPTGGRVGGGWAAAKGGGGDVSARGGGVAPPVLVSPSLRDPIDIPHNLLPDSRKRLPSIEHLVKATPPSPPSHDSSLRQARCKENLILTSWVYYETVPRGVLDNIQALADQNPGTPVRVFCGSSHCQRTVAALGNGEVGEARRVEAELVVLPNIVRDLPPLRDWLALHPINKVLAGKAFQQHLQEALALGLLWKYGGFYVNPLVRTTRQLDFPECRRDTDHDSWVSMGPPLSEGGAPEVFDAAYFSRGHSFVQTLAELFAKEYPKGTRLFHFSFEFRKKAWALIRSPSPSSREHPLIKNETILAPGRLKVESERSKSQHFGTLSYDTRIPKIGLANLGDEIQGFPGMQFLPFVDRFVQRDTITEFQSDGNVSMFFNAWWGSQHATWPPPSNIYPVMVSVHINDRMGKAWAQHIEYAKSHEPIGCRDSDTVKFLHNHGVKAFFTGCMTLFMRNPNVGVPRSDKIYFVDVKRDVETLLPQQIRNRAERVYHNLKDPRHTTNIERYTEAYKLIQKYGRAKLVVTQRIHCALPCVAMGTPVIFINSAGLPGGGGSTGKASERTSGLTPLFHTINLYKSSRSEARELLRKFNWDQPPPNPDASMTMRMRATSWNVIRRHQVYYDDSVKFGIIPMSPPLTSTKAKRYVFHLTFTTSNSTVIGTLGSGKNQFGGEFNWRHWRCLESILRQHPTSEVVVHSNTLSPHTFDVLTEVGYSVRVERYDLQELLRESPAEGFVKRLEGATRGSYWYLHEAELLSLLVLYQQGGVYLSTDTVLVRSIDKLPTNSLGWGSTGKEFLAGAFKLFESGNPFLRVALGSFEARYDGRSLANEQRLLTETWNGWNAESNDVHLLPYQYFYPVAYASVTEQLFEQTQGRQFEANSKLVDTEAYGVFLNATLTGHIGIGSSELKEGTISKDVLNSYCVLCSNLH